MNYIVNRIDLDVHDAGAQAWINVRQNETNRKICIALTESGEPFALTEDCDAVFAGTKPDATVFFNSCEIVGNTIEYVLTGQNLAQTGDLKCEIRLYGGGNTLICSPRFVVHVQENAVDDNGIESSDEFSELTDLISDARAATDAANASVITGATASVDSNIGTPGVELTLTQEENGQSMDFEFHNLKGETGDPGVHVGDTAPTNPAVSLWIDTDDNGASQVLSVMGTFASLAALQAAVTNPNNGDSYGVGAAAPYDIYRYDENSGEWINYGNYKGDIGPTGPTGATGNGVASVTLLSTSGRAKTYRILFTDGTYTDYVVTDGADATSISSIQKTSTAGLVDTYTIFMSDGTTSFFQVTNGQDGEVTQGELDAVADDVADLKNALDEYIQSDSIRESATLVKTIVNASIDSVGYVIVSTSKSRTAVFDVQCAPAIICNNLSNRFVTMFVDTADADVGTTGSPKSRTHHPGNNPTISNYVIPNPTRARYLAIWYATSAVDFAGTLTLVNDGLDDVDRLGRIAGIDDAAIKFETPAGVGAPYNKTANPCLFSVYENSVWINGTIGGGILRVVVYGDTVLSTTSAPSYANIPEAYQDPVSAFVVGHKYAIQIDIVSGEYPSGVSYKPYLDMRTQSGSSVLFGNGADAALGEIHQWDCTFVPEAICLGIRAGTYSNVVFRYRIVDLTLLPDTDIETNFLMREIGNYIVPPYFDSHITTAIGEINTAINGNKTVGTYGTDIEAFVFITDPHWGANKKHSPALIKKVMESCPVSTVICGGDVIESHSATKAGAVAELKDFTDAITGIPCYDYFCVFGNHDDNSNDNSDISTQFTKEEEFNLLYAPFANKANVHWIWEDSPSILSDTKVKNDYYIDHPRTKTRFLCVDWTHPYSAVRQSWIESVLSKNDGYRVVVIYHGIYKYVDSVLTPEHDTIMSILAPYKAKIVAVFSGHSHDDVVADYYGDGSVPVITTSCDKFSESAGAVANTINEQCFDVVVIDYGQSKIRLIRIGRGSNRTVSISLT